MSASIGNKQMATDSSALGSGINGSPPRTELESYVIDNPRISGSRGLTIGGLVLVYLAVAAFAGVGFYLWAVHNGIAPQASDKPSIYDYIPELLGCSVGVFAALLGVKLIRAGGVSASDPLPVVNPKEWAVLSAAVNNRDDPVGEYIRLSSLTGATGFFRKLDLAGLPLATIALTIFFAFLEVFFPDRKFIELTQLTLGAFIGSFVQKQVTTQNLRPNQGGRDGRSGGEGGGGKSGAAHKGSGRSGGTQEGPTDTGSQIGGAV
jgi:hypothetical protein